MHWTIFLHVGSKMDARKPSWILTMKSFFFITINFSQSIKGIFLICHIGSLLCVVLHFCQLFRKLSTFCIDIRIWKSYELMLELFQKVLRSFGERLLALKSIRITNFLSNHRVFVGTYLGFIFLKTHLVKGQGSFSLGSTRTAD